MKIEWKIRLAERRDIGELLVIEEAQFPEPWTKRILLDEIENTETRRYTVAYEKNRIVGYLGVMFVLNELHINTIGTLPEEEGGDRDVPARRRLGRREETRHHARDLGGRGVQPARDRPLLPLRL